MTNDSKSSLYHHGRLVSLDILRGLIIVLMFFGNTRELFGPQAADMTNLQITTPIFFIARWFTHIVAPGFFFLSGISVYLSRRSLSEKSKYLLSRGVWLIALEILVLPYLFGAGFCRSQIYLQALWSLGWSMIVLAFLIKLPKKMIALISFVIIFGHNLLDPILIPPEHSFYAVWVALHGDPQTVAGAYFSYALIPWIGVMAAGYAFGEVFKLEPIKRNKILSVTGSSLFIGFILLRLINYYGDPNPYEMQSRGFLFSLFSFFNTTKYPVSLQYLLMTIGMLLMLIPCLEKCKGKVGAVLTIYGSVPLFLYLIHIPLANYFSRLYFFVRFHMDFWHMPSFVYPDAYKVNILVPFVVWVLISLICYPLAKWYAGVKLRNKKKVWWLKYL